MSSSVAEIMSELLLAASKGTIQPNMDSLCKVLNTSEGIDGIHWLSQNHQDLFFCVIACVPSEVRKQFEKLEVIFNFFNDEHMTESCRQLLYDLILNDGSFKKFTKNKHEEFRMEWFGSRNNQRLSDLEQMVLAIHFGLAIRDSVSAAAVGRLWARNDKSILKDKRILAERFKESGKPQGGFLRKVLTNIASPVHKMLSPSKPRTFQTPKNKYGARILEDATAYERDFLEVDFSKMQLGKTDAPSRVSMEPLDLQDSNLGILNTAQQHTSLEVELSEMHVANTKRRAVFSPSNIKDMLTPQTNPRDKKRGKRNARTPSFNAQSENGKSEVMELSFELEKLTVANKSDESSDNSTDGGRRQLTFRTPAKVSPTENAQIANNPCASLKYDLNSEEGYEVYQNDCSFFSFGSYKENESDDPHRVTPPTEAGEMFRFPPEEAEHDIDEEGNDDDVSEPPVYQPTTEEKIEIFQEMIPYCGFQDAFDAITDTGRLANYFSVNRRGGHQKHFAQIPVSSDKARYLKNARETKWVEHVVQTSGGKGMTEEQKAGYLLFHIINKYPGALEVVRKEFNLELRKLERMDAHKTAAMINEANLTWFALRIIKRYLHDEYGSYVFATEPKIKAISEDFVEAIHDVATVGPYKEISYWYRRPTDIVKSFFEHEFKDLEWDDIQVLFGGDHGARIFSAAIRVTLFNKDGTIVRDATDKIWHIDCTKDTYEILEATGAKILDDSLIKLKNSAIRIHPATGDDEKPLVAFIPLDQMHRETSAAYRTYKMKIRATGDLAFINMLLGKEGMSGHWCYLCDSHKKEFKKIDHEGGVPWTLKKMQEVRNAIESNSVDDKPENRKGCKDKPLFSAFEPWEIAIPILHVMMGLFNDAIKAMYIYVDRRHEGGIPAEEQTKKNKYLDSMIKLRELEEQRASSQAVNEEILFELEWQIEKWTEEKTRKHFDPIKKKDVFTFASSIRKNLENLIRDAKKTVSKIDGDQKTKEKSCTEQAKVVKKAKAEFEAAADKRKPGERKLRQLFDRVLKKNGVDRGASHGGDFTGVACRILENNMEDIMTEFLEVLVKEGNGNDDEIQEIFGAFKIHFLLLSNLFSLLRTPKSDFRDPGKKASLIKRIKKAIRLVDISQHRLGISMSTPKRHLISVHVVEMIELNDGIAELAEDWVERLHQDYLKVLRRAKMRDLAQRARYQCMQDKINNNLRVDKIQKEVAERAERENLAKKAVLAQEQKHLRRIAVREETVDEAEKLFAEKPTLQFALERDIQERLQEIEDMKVLDEIESQLAEFAESRAIEAELRAEEGSRALEDDLVEDDLVEPNN